MKFIPKHLDYTRSPYTGLTRESWIEAGKFLLEGIFHQFSGTEDPIVLTRTETEVSYPHLYAPAAQQERERRAETFEGLARSFFIASVLLHEEPELCISGIPLREYYKTQILRTVTPGDSLYAGSYREMQALCAPDIDPGKPFQQTVETCALVIGLSLSETEIWETCSRAEQDRIADFLRDWAKSSTVPQNWRLFNMLDMAFLFRHGYEIDETIMREHAQAILDYYVGDGWYRDGESFDYYSCWAFNVYGPLWCSWYGYERMPELAAQFEAHSHSLMRSYPDFFDADGWTTMWGRSCIYRNAATSAFDGNLFLKSPSLSYGRARQIASGSLLQFLGREDVFAEGIPSLGFYGQFLPLVQSYSCAESPFWLGKAFLCLHLPKGHPFWTAREERGSFDALRAGEVKETVLDGPALAFTNHGASGETILRTGKVRKRRDDLHGMWNYGKLCYNSKFPWEAAASEQIEPQQYTVESFWNSRVLRGNVIFWCGQREAVLYRRQFFDYRMEEECHWFDAVNLADFPVPLGIFRADKLRLNQRPCIVRLGSYGFPDNGTEILRREDGSGACAVILKGRDHEGSPRQMAMTIYDGWESLRTVESRGTNPDSSSSLILLAEMRLSRRYDASESHVLLSQVITKEELSDFSEEELFPLEGIDYGDPYRSGASGTIRLRLKNGTERRIDYGGIERRLCL